MITDRNEAVAVGTKEGVVLRLPIINGAVIFLDNADLACYVSYRVQTAPADIESAFIDLAPDNPDSVKGNYATMGTLTPFNPKTKSHRVMITINSSQGFVRLLASSSGSALLLFKVTNFAD